MNQRYLASESALLYLHSVIEIHENEESSFPVTHLNKPLGLVTTLLSNNYLHHNNSTYTTMSHTSCSIDESSDNRYAVKAP